MSEWCHQCGVPVEATHTPHTALPRVRYLYAVGGKRSAFCSDDCIRKSVFQAPKHTEDCLCPECRCKPQRGE